MIPYGHQSIDDHDVEAVVKILRSDWLTQGPTVDEFAQALAAYTGAKYAVVVNSGTSALHAAFVAAGLKTGDEFITTPMTFPATSNAGLWQGARPVFVDIGEDGNIDPVLLEEKITSQTKAIVPIDYTGRPASLQTIKTIAARHGLVVIEDACHALGGEYDGQKIGSVSDLTTFSFHPVKNITTGEGGAVLTNQAEYYRAMRKFVTHGITPTEFLRPSPGGWYFEQQLLGLNYRLTDMAAALGLSQLRRLDSFISKRRALAGRYTAAFAGVAGIITPPSDTPGVRSAWHLYVIRLSTALAPRRGEIFAALRAAGVGAQVHYIPVYFHPYYESLGYQRGLCPKAEAWYESIMSLPLYPDLTAAAQEYVIEHVTKAVQKFQPL